MRKNNLSIRSRDEDGEELDFSREVCLKSIFLRERLNDSTDRLVEVDIRQADLRVIHAYCHAATEWQRLPVLARGPLEKILTKAELACVASAENASELARAAHMFALERLVDMALYAAAWSEDFGADWPSVLLARFHQLVLHPHVSTMLSEEEREWGPGFWPTVFEKLAPTTPHLGVGADCGIERYQRAAHCMSRWRDGKITWREIEVPAPTMGSAPEWYPVGHDCLLLHPITFSCAFPNVLNNGDAFWIVRVGRNSLERHPLPLPDLPVDDQLLYVIYLPWACELVVVRNAPDGTPLPEGVSPGDFPKRHLFRDRKWDGLIDKGPGRQPLLRFRLAEDPETESGFTWQQTGEEERIWFDPQHEEDECEQGLMSRRALHQRFHPDHALSRKRSHLGLACTIEEIEAGPFDKVEAFRYTLHEIMDPARIHGRLLARHHPNHALQAMDVDLALVSGDPEAGDYVSEDAFLENLRLYEWNTGELIRTIPLDFKERYIEVEWERGILPGQTQSFVTALTRYHNPDYDRISLTNVITVLVATPDQEEGL